MNGINKLQLWRKSADYPKGNDLCVLSPCGICQERLRYWGEDAQVAVTTEENKLGGINIGIFF